MPSHRQSKPPSGLLSEARVLVIGNSAAGKSTLARRLARVVGGPHIELDALHWGPNWQPREDFARSVDEASRGPRWVADGNYSSVRQTLWPRATTVVWLNYSLPRTFWRGLRRTAHRWLTRQELWSSNRESIRTTLFSRDSILWWILTTHANRRREFTSLRATSEFSQLRWIEFTSPRLAEEWLGALESGGG